MTILFWLIAVPATLCFVTSLLPFIPMPLGIVRVFEFPRLQSAVTSALLMIPTVLFLPWEPRTQLVLAMLVIALFVQLFHIARFTPFWARRSADFKAADHDEDTPRIRAIVANVKLSNRDTAPIMDLVREYDPHIVAFIETDEQWCQDLRPVTDTYPHREEVPMDTGYGMVVCSKLPFRDPQVRYLLNEEVPSFDTRVDLPNGDTFRLFVLHPEPPVFHHDTIGRDAEISKVAELLRDDDEPVIVTGDLNDVAWSRTTRRFLRVARLLDPREGRGQFNTFDARYWFLRWPLDHIFHSPHFKLASMERLPFIGSDHFPMFYDLALTDASRGRREIDEATEQDLDEASDLVETEEGRDRRPIGTDWED